MSPDRQLQALVERVVGSPPSSPFHTPGLAVVVRGPDGRGPRVFAGVDGAGRTIAEDTLFPLASASKLASGLVVLRLIERELLELDAPLARYLPEARAAEPGVTLRALLSHTSGLPLEIAPGSVTYDRCLTWDAVGPACLATPLQSPPGTRVQYSNVAYGLLALVVERVGQEPFRAALERLVFEPLGIEAYFGRELPRRPAAIVDVDSPFVGTDVEPFNSSFSDKLGLPWSFVFTTADGLVALVDVYAGRRPDLLGAALAAEACSSQTSGLGGGFGTTDPFLGFNGSKSITWPNCPWGLSVEVRGDKRPHWTPPSASPASFGQLGSSGCLGWHDPARGTTWALLGVRTTDSGWLLRHGSAIGAIALAATRAA